MTYKEALKVVDDNQHLLGSTVNGGSIDELIILSSNQNDLEECRRIYNSSLDGAVAVKPFVNQNLDVACVFDKDRIRTQGLCVHLDI